MTLKRLFALYIPEEKGREDTSVGTHFLTLKKAKLCCEKTKSSNCQAGKAFEA